MNAELASQIGLREQLVIGIEGPAAAGKTTMAKTVAGELGTCVIEGGTWYRALTYITLKEGIDPSDTALLVSSAQQMNMSVHPQPGGESLVELDGTDITDLLHTESVSARIGEIAQNLAVREVIDEYIRDTVRRQQIAIVVGRHIKRLLPEAAVLHVTIDPDEADRRHVVRAGAGAQSVKTRISTDKKIAQLLGADGISDLTVDVTSMTPEEQADLLRQFIATAHEAIRTLK